MKFDSELTLLTGLPQEVPGAPRRWIWIKEFQYPPDPLGRPKHRIVSHTSTG